MLFWPFQAKPFTWLPGAGMSIQIAVVGYDQVGVVISDTFARMQTHTHNFRRHKKTVGQKLSHIALPVT